MPEEDEEKPTVDLSEPDEELLEWARQELGETADTRVRCLQELKDKIYERGDVEPYRMDDPFLLRFLRARSFDVERAYRLLKRYMRFKDDNPTYQKDVDPQSFRALADDDVMTVLPYLDQHGRRIMLFRIGNWDPSKVDVDDIFRASMIVLEIGIMEQRTQIKGGVVIFDMEGLSLQHVWQATPDVIMKIFQLIETASPMKSSAIHVLNESWAFDILYGMFSPLLGDNIPDKVCFHGSDMSSLHEHIDPKHLPKRYGGTRGEAKYSSWIEAMENSNVIRKELKNLGYRVELDESLDH